MTNEQAQSILEELRTGAKSNIAIDKADFLVFRQSLMAAEDVLNFRGTARHHGITIYTYEPNWS
ncbi:hypothetical protein [Alkalicoccobacillus plakortidis]|uniref:Uncharacterized protein n=1 Tax=Alkalicoccobacillus plakortidis TaxID=444060 RepID=A0ABT0XHG6_9BACI|nr:hypothetical protein [Alkalicoccobacillus plakortidis]MCM2674639.1 hypothetical protein [Alkalicoccobacillus plakortidis]